MTKIIKLKSSLRWLEWRYRALDKLLLWGRRWLPFIFMYSGYLDGKKVTLPKWITQREKEVMDEWVENMLKNLKFD